ncbi:hypothetical protein [Mycoplasmopsis verecunda]|uniref:Lipoprotein n=1 Tax=Mycoplasmopsis verecunda TaxID=171291 RepID=A0A1T4M375_9BACT|nr:hypothetical protein [Mycoplasmopsis verecunda]WPB54711.1 hypothetical protein SAM46_00950 [Mycoplasmopsis verecunda]SJZ61164.1 hypothetical protein SAMN02745154_00613 [Mycoplasmopsis verecunda]
MKKIKSVLIMTSALSLTSLSAVVACNTTSTEEDTKGKAVEKEALLAKMNANLNYLNNLAKPEEYTSFKLQYDNLNSKLGNIANDELTNENMKELRDLHNAIIEKLATLRIELINTSDKDIEAKTKEVQLLQLRVDVLKEKLVSLGVDVDKLLDGKLPESDHTLVSSGEIVKLKEELRQAKALLALEKSKLDSLRSRLISRSASAIDVIKTIQHLNLFLLDTVRTYHKDRYDASQEKELIDNNIKNIEEILKDVETSELSVATSIRVYNSILAAMNTTRLIQSFFLTDNGKIVEVDTPFPKEQFMSDLFEWRINDLKTLNSLQTSAIDKLTKEIKSLEDLGNTTSSTQKTQLEQKKAQLKKLQENQVVLQGVIANYEKAKTQGKNLKNQVDLYYILETEFFDKFIKRDNTSDEYKDSFATTLSNGKTLKISTMPLLNNINDKEALKEFEKMANEIRPKYMEFYSLNRGYLDSVKYKSYYESFLKDVTDLTRYHLIQDLFSKKSIEIYLNSLKYKLATYKIEADKEFNELKQQVDTEFNATWQLFLSTIRAQYNKLNADDQLEKPLGKTYLELNSYFNTLFRDVRNMNSVLNIKEAYDKLLAVKNLSAQLVAVNNMLSYFKDLSISSSDEKMNQYLQTEENAKRFETQIQNNQNTVNEYNNVLRQMDELLTSYKTMDFAQSEQEKIIQALKNNVAILNKFINDFKDKKVSYQEDRPEEKSYFATAWSEFDEKIDNALKQASTLSETMNKLANSSSNLDELKAQYTQVAENSKVILKLIYDDSYDTTTPYSLAEQERDDAQSQIRRFKRRIQEAKDSSFIIPLNEVYIMLRQGQIANSEFFGNNSVTDRYKKLDAVAYNLTTDALRKLQQSDSLFRSITSPKSSSIEVLSEEDPVAARTKQKEIFDNILKNEKAYYQANLEYLKAKNSNLGNIEELQKNLQEARDTYYTYLRSKDFSLQKDELNPSASKYNFNDKNELNPAKVLILYAKYTSVKEVLEYIIKTSVEYK